MVITSTDWILGRYLQRRIIAVSADLGTKLSNEFPHKVTVIENGVDIDTIRQTLDADLRYSFDPPGARHIGIAGRLDAVKRIDLFLEAAAELRRRGGRDYRFHVIGDGKLRQELEIRSMHLGLHGEVQFHGHRQDILECLTALDVLVMSSDHEGLPMVALESITVGTPVVAHAVGGLVPLLAGNAGGVLVDRHAATAYADAITSVLESDTADMMAQGLARIRSDYSASRNAARIAALYREIQSERG
jgi:glycosyltransferase involved in cell wall biosynthesis